MLGKSRFLLLLVLLGVAALAADYLDSFSSYRSQIRRKLGIDVTNTTYMSDSTLNEFVREGVVMVAQQARVNKVTVKATTAFKRTHYTVGDSVLGIYGVTISMHDTTKALLYVPKELWYQQEHKNTMGQTDLYLKRPSYYDFYNGKVSVYPAPSLAGDTLTIDCWARIARITDSTALTTIDQRFRPAVLAYAVWQAAESRQHPKATVLYEQYQAILQAVTVNDGRVNAASGNTAATGK